jgi:hypothetical protein
MGYCQIRDAGHMTLFTTQEIIDRDISIFLLHYVRISDEYLLVWYLWDSSRLCVVATQPPIVQIGQFGDTATNNWKLPNLSLDWSICCLFANQA